MKNTLIKIALFLLIFTTSCSDFLEENPKSIVSPETILNSVDGFDLTLTGIYSHISGWGNLYGWNTYFLYEGFVDFQDSPSTFSVGNILPNDYALNQSWRHFYSMINTSNLIIKNIDAIEGSKEKNRIEGEAKFIRAWSYFSLVQFYGDVPLITEPVSDPPSFQPSRTDQVEVYNQIVKDMKDAVDMLENEAPTPTRVNKWVAKGFLTKIYLTMSGNPNNIDMFEGESTAQLALNQAIDIINSGRYSINIPYEDVFFTDNDAETIWEIRTTSNRLGNIMPFLTQQMFRPTDEFSATFESTDIRGPLWGISTSYDYNGTTYTFPKPTYLKFIDKESFSNQLQFQSELSITALRYADVLLMAAEADNEVNNGPSSSAYEWINAVRNRAGIDNLSDLDYSSFKDAVFFERRHELYGEGFSWWDLKRYNKFSLFNNVSRTLVTPIDDHLNYFPIYEVELITNPNMTQNPGWPE